MSGLSYVGATAAVNGQVTNRLATNTLLAGATPNTISVQAQVDALTSGGSATYASKSYVDTQDATFTSVSYYQSQDALNVPNAAVGAVNLVSGVPTALSGSYYGVASLDSAGRVPAAQMPVLGAGYIQGPYGITAFSPGNTSNTPLRIADWNIGAVSLSFQPLVFMQCFVLGLMSHPIIEVRIANSSSAVSYASSTLVAQGEGRGLYNDYHSVVVLPVPDTTGSTPTNLGPSYNVWLSAWLYDLNSQNATISAGGIATAAAFLLRGAQ